jgi:hypothetical protein
VEVVFDEEIWFLKLEVSLQPDNLNIDLQAYFVLYVIFQCYTEYTQCLQLRRFWGFNSPINFRCLHRGVMLNLYYFVLIYSGYAPIRLFSEVCPDC